MPYFLVGLPWSSGSLSDSPDWLSRGPAGGAAVAADAAVADAAHPGASAWPLVAVAAAAAAVVPAAAAVS